VGEAFYLSAYFHPALFRLMENETSDIYEQYYSIDLGVITFLSSYVMNDILDLKFITGPFCASIYP
jgi:hypothetical protein